MIAFPRRKPERDGIFLIWRKGRNVPELARFSQSEGAFYVGNKYDHGDGVDGWEVLPTRRPICPECGADFTEWCYMCARTNCLIS